MQITRIILENFRNYIKQEITVQPDINVFYGANAQGKTNILEAVYLCACARSHRTSRDQDLINQNSDQYSVTIYFKSDNGNEECLEIRYLNAVTGDPLRMRATRIINHNGIKLEKIGDLIGLFHAVIFAPEDLMLVKEGPANRRRFLDLLISQVRPVYFYDLQRYARLLQQRNKLLKDLRFQNTDEDQQLDIWDQQLADVAASLIVQRLNFTERIQDIAASVLAVISAGQENLEIRYKTLANIDISMNQTDISGAIYKKFKKTHMDDKLRGSTGNGPHRDDLDIILNGEPIKPFASQGQQRSVVLALKLAELKIIQQEIGEQPVLLLDDVMSELDMNRRHCLLASIDQAQIFITSTDLNHVVADMNARIERHISCFAVHNGLVDPNHNDGFCEYHG